MEYIVVTLLLVYLTLRFMCQLLGAPFVLLFIGVVILLLIGTIGNLVLQ